MMRSIGMDVHRSFAQVAIHDDGAIVANFRVDMEHDAVVAFGRNLQADDEVVLEVGLLGCEIATVEPPMGDLGEEPDIRP